MGSPVDVACPGPASRLPAGVVVPRRCGLRGQRRVPRTGVALPAGVAHPEARVRSPGRRPGVAAPALGGARPASPGIAAAATPRFVRLWLRTVRLGPYTAALSRPPR